MSHDPQDLNAGRRHFLIGLGVVAAGTAAGIYVMPKYLAAREAAGAAPVRPPVRRPHRRSTSRRTPS